MNSLKTKESCKFLLQYHFIFVCKYRKMLNPIRNDILSTMVNIAKSMILRFIHKKWTKITVICILKVFQKYLQVIFVES